MNSIKIIFPMTPKERIKAFISQILEATEPESVTNVIVATLLELMQDYMDGADEGLRELVRDEKGDRVRADRELENLYDGLLGDVTSPQFIGMNPALKGLSDTVNTHSDKINDHEGRITDHEARIAENTLMRDNILPLDELVDIPESSSLFTDGLGMSADKVVWNTAIKRLWGWNSTTNHYYSSWPTWRQYGTKAGTGAKGVIPAANRILYMASNPQTLYVKSNTAGLEQLHEATVNRTLANYNHLLAVDKKIGRLEENEADDERRITAVEEVAEMGRTKANAVQEATKGARFININTFTETDDAFPSLSDALDCVPEEYRWHYGTVVTFLYEGMWIVNGKQKRVRKWLWYRWTATAGDEDADWLHTGEWEQLPDESDITTIKKRLDAAASALEDARLHDLIATAEAAGAVWNEETRLFSLNTLDDITVDEMRRIIQWGQVDSASCKGRYCGAGIRTNLPFLTGLSGGGGADTGFSCECMFANSALEVVRVNSRFRPVSGLSQYAGVFHADSIRKIIGVVDLLFKPPCFSPSGNFAPFGAALEEVQIRNLQTNLWLGNCPKLRPEAVRYAIAQRNDQNGDKTQLRITLHPDVYALVTDPDNAEGVEIMALADEKNVTIATTE